MPGVATNDGWRGHLSRKYHYTSEVMELALTLPRAIKVGDEWGDEH